MDRPDDLVDMAEAASMAERSASTVRRWLRDGKLERYDGPEPEHGGSPLALVSRSELLALLQSSGQSPRPTTPKAEPVATVEPPDDNALANAVELERLRGQVEAERLRGQVARLEAELSAAEDRARRAEESLDGVSRDRDDWRDRHDAREAEVRALRTASGLPWWRRLISGPAPVAELEDRDS